LLLTQTCTIGPKFCEVGGSGATGEELSEMAEM